MLYKYVTLHLLVLCNKQRSSLSSALTDGKLSKNIALPLTNGNKVWKPSRWNMSTCKTFSNDRSMIATKCTGAVMYVLVLRNSDVWFWFCKFYYFCVFKLIFFLFDNCMLKRKKLNSFRKWLVTPLIGPVKITELLLDKRTLAGYAWLAIVFRNFSRLTPHEDTKQRNVPLSSPNQGDKVAHYNSPLPMVQSRVGVRTVCISSK